MAYLFSHLALQLEQEIQALEREREWLRAEHGRATEALAESEARAAMVAEDGRTRRAQLEGHLEEMARQLTRVADRALTAEEAEAALQARVEAEQHVIKERGVGAAPKVKKV